MFCLNKSGKEIWREEFSTPDFLVAIAFSHRKLFPKENAELTFKMSSYRVYEKQ